MSKITDLKKKVADLQKKNTAAIRERAEVARLEATLKLEQSPTLLDARVRLELKGSVTKTLQQLVDECAAIIASMPVHNPKTRTERVWNGNHRYNYGTQIDLLYQLATGILYSCKEHKQLLTTHVPVDPELWEQFLKAFGTPRYYSRNHHTVVEEKPADFKALQEIIAVLQSQLNIVLDTSELTQKGITEEFQRAELLATKNYDDAVEAISTAEFVL